MNNPKSPSSAMVEERQESIRLASGPCARALDRPLVSTKSRVAASSLACSTRPLRKTVALGHLSAYRPRTEGVRVCSVCRYGFV